MKRICTGLLVALCSASLMAQGVMPIPKPSFVDQNGVPVSQGKLCTYAAGTSTPQATCADNQLSAGACVNANSNPVLLDSAGRATVYLTAAAYKFTLLTAGSDNTCSTGTQVWTQDNVSATAPYNLASITGKVIYTSPTVLTVTSNAITPTGNIHAVDTGGGAANLTTINVTNAATGMILVLYANNPGANPVTIQSGINNISLRRGNFTLNAVNRFIMFMDVTGTWWEIARSDNDGAIEGPELKSYYETYNNVTISAGAVTLDLSTGNHFATNLTGNYTVSITNPCASGKACAFTYLTHGTGAATVITWPASVLWPGGTAPTVTTTNGKTDVYSFYSVNGGTNWYGFVSGQNF